MQDSHYHLYNTRKKTKKHTIINVSVFDLFICHQCHKGGWSYSDVLTTTEHTIDETTHECRIQTVLKKIQNLLNVTVRQVQLT